MIKVICIDGTFFDSITREKAIVCPKEGEICTVIDLINNTHYVLEEYPKDEYYCSPSYNKNKFIPLSNIDETELIKERELLTEKV